jgi:site-specific DNA-cytosine methylase
VKRFASFPDQFRFEGTWSDAIQRIGNSVPPRFMQKIAEHLKDNVLAGY